MFRRSLLWASLLLVLMSGGFWAFCPKPALYGDFSFSSAVFDGDGGLLRLSLADDSRYRLYTPLERITPAAVEATLLYEDRHFYKHPGVNPLSVMRGAWSTYITRQRTLGASTISMQLARLRFGLNSRAPSGKILQILRALQLERHYSKNELLEAYLNLAPYGGNVEGIGTAARIYFGKPASRLTLPEALTLVVIPQDPNARRPRAHGQPHGLVEARQRAYERWLSVHPEDERWASRIASSLSISSTADLPFRAPHFVDRLLTTGNYSGDVHTTLSPHLQTLAEDSLHRHLAQHQTEGLNNGAVLIVDSRDMSVQALVGSADWYDNDIHGQVNGTAAPRSPGSALKPFIYALALDQGLIHPITLLADSPVRYGAYAPENFDRGFVGPISAQDALIYSRNLPAVALTAQLQAPDFHRFLKQAGIQNMRSREHYGLAIALGGMEISMEEMVGLYGALANGGVQRNLAFLKEEAKLRPGQRLVSAEAALITSDILARNPRPGVPAFSNKSRESYIPWKTGTSYAFRDAWSIGQVGPYVVAVWLGNFDGQGNPALVGIQAAAPLFFRIADNLRNRGIEPMAFRPKTAGLNLRKEKVCASTGDLPNRHCPGTAETWFIPGVSPIAMSNIHRSVLIDKATGLRACPGTIRDVEIGVFEFWPSDMLHLFRQAGLPRRMPPPFVESCSLTEVANTGTPPRIVSPQAQLTYTRRASGVENNQIAFQATTDADANTLYWFLDDRLLGRSTPNKPFFWEPQPGLYQVRVVDDLGRADVVTLRVNTLSSGR